jgi:hypothetical protein
MSFKVNPEHRTHELSYQEGGVDVKVTYTSGKVVVYDKVKYPEKYINSINKLHVQRIEVGDVIYWVRPNTL